MFELPGGDGVDDLLLGRLFALEERHALPEPEDGDPVRDLEHVMQVVGDDRHGEIPLRETPDEVQHLTRLRHAECGRGLVEDDDPGVPHHRLRHGDRLALTAGKAGDRLADGLQRGDREPVERLARGPLHRRLVEHDGSARPLAAEEHVRDDVEVVGQRQVLVDDLDPESSGVARSVDVDGLALDENLAFVERIDAGNALDQRRLAGAVVADEGHHLSSAHLEVDLVERLHGAERLRGVSHFKERGVGHEALVRSGRGGTAQSLPASVRGFYDDLQNSVCAVSPVQSSFFVRNPSAITVSWMLSAVTPIGVRAK